MKVLNVKWFSNMLGTIGIVLYENTTGEKRCSISMVNGMNPNEDIQYIINWGAKFPVEVAEKFEPGIF